MLSRDPKAAPKRRFKVVLRTWTSNKTMPTPKATPVATANGSSRLKGRRYHPAAPSSRTNRARSIKVLITKPPPKRAGSENEERPLCYKGAIEYTTENAIDAEILRRGVTGGESESGGHCQRREPLGAGKY